MSQRTTDMVNNGAYLFKLPNVIIGLFRYFGARIVQGLKSGLCGPKLLF